MADDTDDESPEALVAALVDLLVLEQIDSDLFRGGQTREPWVRVYGGQVIGQALMAACRTVDASRPPHSLHAYFVRPGDPHQPIIYRVYRDRDGGSFTFRRVVAMQSGKPILNLAASFQIREPGLEHQLPMPALPGPEGLLNDREIALQRVADIPAERRPTLLRARPLEFRAVEPETRYCDTPMPPSQNYWFRAIAPLPDDPILHRVLLAYASDMMLLAASLVPHGIGWLKHRLQEASLDHALWIHEDLRLDEWLLYAQDSPWSGGARGMNRGLIYTREGRLVASVAQEGLIRVREVKG